MTVADIVKSAYQATGTPMLRATLIIVAAVLARARACAPLRAERP